ncbi:hypothetical protein ACFQU2_09730 [Siccirubricoccus deserti]
MMTNEAAVQRREAARRRSEEYRQRRSRGAMVVHIEVVPTDLHALERLGLLPRGERDPYTVACAVATFLQAAPGVAMMGERMFPEPMGPSDAR